jgi:hypothetical protein
MLSSMPAPSSRDAPTVGAFAFLFVTAITGGVALTGCFAASEPAAAETAEIRGVLSVPAVEERMGDVIVIDDDCTAEAGFDDVHKAAQVAVLDPEGTIVAIGELGKGKYGSGGSVCSFPFTISDVPLGKKFYSLDVGNEFRGIHTIPEDELGVYQTLSIG